MTYEPRKFWDERLSEQFDLRGTGEPGLSLRYNRACYALRRKVLEGALRRRHITLASARVLDVGCGTGFWTSFYIEQGAEVTGVDIAPTSIERLRQRYPQARFELLDVSAAPVAGQFDVVNVIDVLYHITDEARFDTALRHLAAAVAPGGTLLVTDLFAEPVRQAEHNRMRGLPRYSAILEPAGFSLGSLHPTHVLMNRELGPFRFMNRLPSLLHALDVALLGAGFGHDRHHNKLLVAQRAVSTGSWSASTRTPSGPTR